MSTSAVSTSAVNMTVTNNHNPYLQTTPAPPPPSASHALQSIGRKFDSAAKKAGNFAGNLYTHLRTGPGLVDVAMTRLDHTARVIVDGGSDNVYRREFGCFLGEKLKEAYVCYLSTTEGPLMGTLYISNKRVGFKSDYPVWSGTEWVYYKLMLMVDQILSVNPSTSVVKPGEKYIQVLTKDDHEFWFMGFVFYDQAINHLHRTISHCH